MNDIELAEEMLGKYAMVKGPYTSGPRQTIFQFLVHKAPEIRKYLALGIDAVEPRRRRVVVDWLAKDSPNVTQTEQSFNVWVADTIMGPRIPGSALVQRCMGCQKIRTNRGLINGPCKCGSNRAGPVREFTTSQGLYALATGY